MRCSREEIDLAVHSAKDMAAVSPDGLDDRRRARRAKTHATPWYFRTLARPRVARALPAPASHLRRHRASAPAVRAGSRSCAGSIHSARFESIRGNVDTRLRKLDAGEVDALVLACAGLRRLGLVGSHLGPVAVDRLRAGAGPGDHRHRGARATTSAPSCW